RAETAGVAPAPRSPRRRAGRQKPRRPGGNRREADAAAPSRRILDRGGRGRAGAVMRGAGGTHGGLARPPAGIGQGSSGVGGRPAAVIALARLDIPGLMLYGGAIRAGRYRGRDVTIGDVFEAVGKHAVGAMSDGDLRELEAVACPGPGACGGQFTANTMATAFEALGISPAGSSGPPAVDARRPEVMRAAGGRVMEMLREDFRPSRVLKRENFE